MSWQRRSTIATTLLAMLALVGVPTAFAADSPDDVPDGLEWSASQERLVDPFEVDAARYAKAFGTDYLKQLTQLQAIVALDKPLAALEDDTDYGGSYWASVDELVVMFKGGAPGSTLDALRSRSTIKVTGKDVRFSLRDLDRIRDDAVGGVRDAGIANDDIVSGIDPKANEVFITARATSASTKESARTKVENRTPAGAVSLSFTAGSVGEDTADLYGGAKLYDGASFWCTNGFTVQNANGVKGTLAAAHCPPVDKWVDWYEGTSTSTLTLKAQHLGEWGDMEWHTSGINETDDFYYRHNGSRRDVEYVKTNYSVGDPVSGYGRGGPSQWDDEVKVIHVSQAGAERLVCTKNQNDDYGDSGGPIYNANVAVGIHKGHFDVQDKVRSCFSQTRYVDDALNVEIFR